ncbi:uncharacterized protein LOC114531859 [Dendronephthya gigantea]|uniref:uncharacterized protein LOC114531859 n=1 Tax=Dendronephthya gigantea TaxID=151771 RepID=UPI00106C2DF1|nr:uncharacterized protein LOC114531859 [Dendronephthya gigantea]
MSHNQFTKVMQDEFLAVLDRKLEDKLKPILRVIDDLAISVQYMSDNFDSISKRIDDLDEKYKSVIDENKCLKAEVLRLSQMMSKQEEDINNLQQYTRRDCVEIAGLPRQMGEKTNDLVIKVGLLMGLSLDESDISTSHRLPQPTNRNESYAARLRPRDGANINPPKIIVKFVRRETKEAFYYGRKLLADKSAQDIGLGRLSNGRIYISESLSPKNKDLFGKCLKFKRDHGFKFIWTHSGRIYLRKDKDSPAHIISKVQDLENV